MKALFSRSTVSFSPPKIKKNRINEAKEVDKRTVGYKRRMLAVEKGTIAMLELLKSAKKADIPAKYVLFEQLVLFSNVSSCCQSNRI